MKRSHALVCFGVAGLGFDVFYVAIRLPLGALTSYLSVTLLRQEWPHQSPAKLSFYQSLGAFSLCLSSSTKVLSFS